MVERWSSKPYAWVRFLLPLYNISLNTQLRQSRISQHSYFNSISKHPFKKTNLYKAFSAKLFSKKKSKTEKVYFRPIPRINRSFRTRGLGLFIQKLRFLTTYNGLKLNLNPSHFQMFINNRAIDLISTDSRLCRYPISHNNVNEANVSYSLAPSNLLVLGESSLRPLPTPQGVVSLDSTTNTKLLRSYYSNLQPKSTKLVSYFRLLKTLTSRYNFVRKVQNNWEHFSNWRKHSSRFTNYGSPTLSTKPHHRVNLVTPQTLVSTPATSQNITRFHPTPVAHSLNLFGKLFTKNLFTSFLVYKRFYLSSPLLTERPNKLLTKYFYLRSRNEKQLLSNIVCIDLPKTPKLFLNLKGTKTAKFQTNFLCWYNFLLVRFLQHTTGLKVSLMFNPFLHKTLSLAERAQLDLWTQRVKGFQRIIGPKISLKESLQVTYLSLKLKDPSLFSSWLSRTIHKVSFWKYRAFFRYLKFLLQNLFLPSFSVLGMKGVKLKLKGKVSVAGNARTRSIYYRVGSTGQSTLNSKVLHNLTFFYTFTGILGLQIWFYF